MYTSPDHKLSRETTDLTGILRQFPNLLNLEIRWDLRLAGTTQALVSSPSCRISPLSVLRLDMVLPLSQVVLRDCTCAWFPPLCRSCAAAIAELKMLLASLSGQRVARLELILRVETCTSRMSESGSAFEDAFAAANLVGLEDVHVRLMGEVDAIPAISLGVSQSADLQVRGLIVFFCGRLPQTFAAKIARGLTSAGKVKRLHIQLDMRVAHRSWRPIVYDWINMTVRPEVRPNLLPSKRRLVHAFRPLFGAIEEFSMKVNVQPRRGADFDLFSFGFRHVSEIVRRNKYTYINPADRRKAVNNVVKITCERIRSRELVNKMWKDSERDNGAPMAA